VDWLKGQGFGPGRIGVLAISLGAASSIGATADDTSIGALVIDSGFADIWPLIKKQWRAESGLPDFFLPSTRLMHCVLYGHDIAASRPVDEVGKIAPRPILLIHSTADLLVPITNAEQLKQAAPHAETWWAPDAKHARVYNTHRETYTDKVIAFLDRSME
jgi:fermentation-respiration switch protein FrsA (DUF1100 family)